MMHVLALALLTTAPGLSLTAERNEVTLETAAATAEAIFVATVVSSTPGPEPFAVELVFDRTEAGRDIARHGEHIIIAAPRAALPGARYVVFFEPGKQHGPRWAPLAFRLREGESGDIGVVLDTDNRRFVPETLKINEVSQQREINWLDRPAPTVHKPPIVLASFIDMEDFRELVRKARKSPTKGQPQP